MKDKGEKLKALAVQDNLLGESDWQDIYYKIFHYSPQGIALTDDSGGIVECNPVFTRWVVEAPVKIELCKWLPASGWQQPSSEGLIDTGKGVLRFVVVPVLLKSLEARWLWMVAEENHLAREKLSSLKNLYRSFVDNTFELVFRTSDEGTLVFSNRLFVHSFGFESYTRAKGHSILDLVEEPAVYERIKARARQEKRVTQETINFKRLDGTRLTGLVNCHFYNNEKGEPMLNWTVLDISDRIEFENKLKANHQQLAKVNQQMERFLYSTSHDLRSPLTSILGLVNLMRLETRDKLVLDYVEKIERSATRLDSIISDILTFSRATYQRLKSERINFEVMLWKAVQSCQHNQTSHIAIEINVTGNPNFYSDAERVELIIENLLRNAFQFFDPGKARPFIRVQVTVNEKEAQLEFLDNGIGIGRQHLDLIFNMFYKASHLSKGAGLGLYIVKEALLQLEGTITVESEIGFGSAFRVTIPNDHKGKLINRKLQLRRATTRGK